MIVKRAVCIFCADEVRDEFHLKYPDVEDWKDGKPLWKEYRNAQRDKETLCVRVAQHFGEEEMFTWWMCKRHLQEALDLLEEAYYQ